MTTPKQRYLTRSAAQALIEQRRQEYRQAKKNRFSGEETPTQQMSRWDSPLTYHTDGTPPWWQVPNPMPEVVVKPDQSTFVPYLQNEELQSQAAQQWGLDRLAEMHRIAQEVAAEEERERAAKRTIESIQMENIGKM